MLLITKPNGFLYVNADTYVPIEEIKLDLSTLSTPKQNSKALISFNGHKFLTYYEGMPIPKEFHKSNSLSIRIRLVDKVASNDYTEYTADTLAVSNIVVVGTTLKQGYPKLMAAYEVRTTELEEKVELLEQALLEHINAGSIL